MRWVFSFFSIGNLPIWQFPGEGSKAGLLNLFTITDPNELPNMSPYLLYRCFLPESLTCIQNLSIHNGLTFE